VAEKALRTLVNAKKIKNKLFLECPAMHCGRPRDPMRIITTLGVRGEGGRGGERGKGGGRGCYVYFGLKLDIGNVPFR
jgi:hypothetical protein